MRNKVLDKTTKILIVGCGLIGGSYAMGLSAKGYDVTGLDSNPEAIEFGLQKGFFHRGCTEIEPEVLREAEFVVMGLYPTAMLDWLRANQRHLAPGTLITDVSGVKSNIVDAAQEFLDKLEPLDKDAPGTPAKRAAFSTPIIISLPTPTSSSRRRRKTRRRPWPPCASWRVFWSSKPSASWISASTTR